MDEFLHAFLLIIGFVAVLLAAYLVTKLLGSKLSYSSTARHIKIMDRVFISSDKSICIVQIGKRYFVLGVTNHHIDAISELEESDLLPISMEENVPFQNLFEQYINRFRKNSRVMDQGVDRIQQIKESLEKHKRTMGKM